MSVKESRRRTFTLAGAEMVMGGRYLGRLRESKVKEMPVVHFRARMKKDGYLFLRGLLGPSMVLKARETVLGHLDKMKILDVNSSRSDGVLAKMPKVFTWEVTHLPGFLQMAESPELLAFFSRLFGKPAIIFDYKWLRAVGPGPGTGVHYDVVYMVRGSLNLLTCWIPLGDVPLAQGPLAVLEDSHRLPST